MNDAKPENKLTLAGIALRYSRLAVFLLIPATLTPFIGQWHFLLELGSHFVFHYFAVAVLCLVFIAAWKQWRWAALALIVAIINGAQVVPWYVPQANATGASVRVLEANVQTENQNTSKILAYIEKTDADILVIQEINGRWASALAPLEHKYTYRLVHPREDNFGIAVYSKIEIEGLKSLPLGEGGVPYIKGTIRIDGKPVELLAVHTLPPANSEYARYRNEQLILLRDLVQKTEHPALIVGDLNVTMWSPHYRRLMDAALHDARSGFGMLPTWPAGLSPVKIPIDHVLHETELVCVSLKRGPNIGSDHYPLLAEIAYNSDAPLSETNRT